MLADIVLKRYKEKLQKAKTELLREIESEKQSVDFGHDAGDEDEETDRTEEKGNELAVKRVLKDRVERIDEALARIAEGTYGICTQCGMMINEKILDVAPESTLCEKCKTQNITP